VASKERLNFEEACKELQIPEDEMEQLVANGEIASLKEGDAIFFKKDVVAQFKKARKTEPTIILADSDMDILDGLEDMDLGGKGAKAPASMEDIVIEPRSAEGKAAMKAHGDATPSTDDTVLNLDGLLEDDGSEGTTPIPGAMRPVDESSDITVEGNVSDETLLDTNLLEIGEEQDSFNLDTSVSDDGITEPMEANLLRGGGSRPMQMKRKQGSPGLTITMALTAVLLMIPLGITLNTLFITKSAAENKMLVEPVDPKVKSPPTVYKWIIDATPKWVSGTFETISDWF